MKKQFPKTIIALNFAALILSGSALADRVPAPEPARADALIYQLKQDCGSCHGLTLKGGLGPALLPENLAENDDDMLVDTILYGRPGTPMPPWNFEISKSEAQWLVQILKEGLK